MKDRTGKKYNLNYFVGAIIVIFIISYILNFSLYSFLMLVSLATLLFIDINFKWIAYLGLLCIPALGILLTIEDYTISEILAKIIFTLVSALSILTFLKHIGIINRRIPFRSLYRINTQTISVLIIFLVLVFMFKGVFLSSGIIEVGDIAFSIFPERVISTEYLWSQYGSSERLTNASLYPIVSANNALFGFFSLSASTAIKFILLEFIITSAVSLYSLAKFVFSRISNNQMLIELSCAVVTIFYITNPYSVNRILHFHIWLAYLFAPLVFFLFFKAVDSKKLVYWLCFATSLAFLGFSPHYFTYITASLALWVVLRSIACLGKKLLPSRIDILKTVAALSIICFVVVLISSYWITPIWLASMRDSSIESPSYVLTADYIEPVDKVLAGLKENASLNAREPESKTAKLILAIVVFVIPWLLFIPFILKTRSRHLKFMSILGLATLLASSLPIVLPGIYVWLMFEAPYLKSVSWLFRESFRINGLLAFSYSFMFGLMVLKSRKIATPLVRIVNKIL